MKASRSLLLMCALLVITRSASVGESAPLAPELARALTHAKTVYLISGHVQFPKTKAFIKTEWVDSTPFEEPLHKEFEKWGRFTLAPDAKSADLIVRAYMTGSTQSVPVFTPGVTGSVTVGSTFIVLDVVQPSSRKILWSASKASARSWSTNTAVSGLVKELRKFVEQQEAAQVPDTSRVALANSGSSPNTVGAQASANATLTGNASVAASMSAKQIASLRHSINEPYGDYFLGSPDEQRQIVSAFVQDNSNSDPTYLYLASNTAFRLGQIKDAGFLFYAAQIRKRFDYQRYGLGTAKGSDIQTYWGFLNQTIGEEVNPAITRVPQEFSEVVSRIEKWEVIPSDDAYYDKQLYGTYALPKAQWHMTADVTKKQFLEQFAYRYKAFIDDPGHLQAVIFMQDYNAGKIQHTPENDKQFQRDQAIMNQALGTK